MRLSKICDLIRDTQLGIHDLSRMRASRKGEFYRMNMPFELGIQLGNRVFGGAQAAKTRILVLESKRHEYQKAISDLAGCDIKAHESKPARMIKGVRDWAVETLGRKNVLGPTGIWNRFNDFMYDLHNRCLEHGYSEEDFESISIADYLAFLEQWFAR